MHRRRFVAAAAAGMAATWSAGRAVAAQSRPTLKAKRLSAGDRVALVSPASATFNTVDLDIARESLEALGLKVESGEHLLDRRGYLAGADKDRAADINHLFADRSIHAVLPIRGGWGSSRLLPYIDFDVIARHPKVFLGFSDISALHMAIQAKTGLVTFHGPNASGRWDAFSADWVRRVLFDAEAVTFENSRDKGEFLAQTENRVQTIAPGKARGCILGGNLSVISGIVGSPYVPDFDGAILFLEDVGEDLYRIDRMLTTLKLSGVLDRISGFVLGACTDCEPGEGYGSLTLREILDDVILPLKIPAWYGAMIGHRIPQFTIPEGLQVEIDATACSIRMLEPAVL